MSFEQLISVVSEYQRFSNKSQPPPLKMRSVDDMIAEPLIERLQKSEKTNEKVFLRKSQITKGLTGKTKTNLNLR